jgi:serine/threonine-protein kinase
MTVGMTTEPLKDRYQILQELGSGGFGETFLAEDTHMPSRRKCVIKRLKAVNDNPQISQLIQQRFEREAALLEDLGDHPQIPRLYAYFAETVGEALPSNHRFYLVEEWIEGQTFNQKLKQTGILGESAVKELMLSLLQVLEFIQSKGIIHRDIKPENIILRASDGKPVLIDFGSVKETMSTIVTASGNSERSIIAGTPGFMPSEQCAGRPVFASDLYSLALTAIYLLLAKQPAELESEPHTGEIHWRHLAPHLSGSFADFLDKAILPNARDRFINAKMMLDALRSLPISAPPTILTKSQESRNNSAPATEMSVNNQSAPPTQLSTNNRWTSQAHTNNGSKASEQAPPTVIVKSHQSDRETATPPQTQTHNDSQASEQAPPTVIVKSHQSDRETAEPTPNTVVAPKTSAQTSSIETNTAIAPKQENKTSDRKGWTLESILVLGGSAIVLIALIVTFILKNNTNIFTTTPTETSQAPTTQGTPDSQAPTTQETPASTEQPEPTASPAQSTDINTPPTISLGNGRQEQASEPNALIDGYWRLDFSVGQVHHQSILHMSGKNGEMVTEYFDVQLNKTQRVRQTMRLWSSSMGLIAKGYNPVDAETQQPHATYQPDEILIQQKTDGTYYADNCSGGVCSNTSIQYLGTTLEQNN